MKYHFYILHEFDVFCSKRRRKGSSFGSLHGTPTKIREDGFTFSIQMSGLSLEQLAKLRPDQLDRLQRLVEKPNCEFIGNGYSQMIQPPDSLGS